MKITIYSKCLLYIYVVTIRIYYKCLLYVRRKSPFISYACCIYDVKARGSDCVFMVIEQFSVINTPNRICVCLFRVGLYNYINESITQYFGGSVKQVNFASDAQNNKHMMWWVGYHCN